MKLQLSSQGLLIGLDQPLAHVCLVGHEVTVALVERHGRDGGRREDDALHAGGSRVRLEDGQEPRTQLEATMPSVKQQLNAQG